MNQQFKEALIMFTMAFLWIGSMIALGVVGSYYDTQNKLAIMKAEMEYGVKK